MPTACCPALEAQRASPGEPEMVVGSEMVEAVAPVVVEPVVVEPVVVAPVVAKPVVVTPVEVTPVVVTP